MSTFLAQLPTLIGVLVGTLGTILATSLADRTRWKRSQGVRWDERRLDAYIEFARAIKEIHAVAVRMLANERPGSRGHRIDREAGLAKLAEADVRHTLAWESVLLLGDEPTVLAARVWRDVVRDIERVARGLAEQAADIPDLLHRANEGRDAFYRAARGDLGVRSGSVAQSAWLINRLNGAYAGVPRPSREAEAVSDGAAKR